MATSSDARGLRITDDIASGLSNSDPATFWSTNQFYVKAEYCDNGSNWSRKDLESVLKILSTIPDHHFSLIQSLCLDFGWYSPRGFLRCDDWSCTCPNLTSFKLLLQDILRRRNKRLVVKILWNTTMSFPLERLTRWQENRRRWGYDCFESRSAQFSAFRDYFNSLCRHMAYNEDRIILISRVNWKEEMPDEIDWDWPQVDEYEESENKIFEIDPVSNDFVWKEAWEETRISYGLMWDPIEGHF